MNVVRQDIDALNAKLKVQIVKEDYQTQVTNSLEKHRKTAKVPGFRPGHVPMSYVQKQFGKAVVAEELNKVVNQALNNFIKENNIEILGNPLPSEKEEVTGDFNNPDTFEFSYDLGLSPKIEVPLTAKSKFDYVKIKIDDTLINKQVEDLQRRYGKMTSAESIEEKDLMLCQFVELKEDESILEGGILHSSTISTEFVEDKKVKKSLLGMKIGDKLIVNPKDVSKGGKDTAAMLGIKEEELNNISSKFQITVNEIKRMELAELSQEIFDKLYGEGEVKTEAEMRSRIAGDLDKMFATDSDRLLTKSVYEELIAKTKVELP
ncbi:MAG: trigger factor, partial [Psychromonas sp.]